MHRSLRTAFLSIAPMLTACGATSAFHPSTPADVAAAGSPLGPSYVLVPLPNDDDMLLGRVMLSPLEDGHSLDEVSRPNECGDKLTPKKEGPLASTFEDGQELSAGGRARAALGAFGFEGDAQTATHFYYKLDVNKRVAQSDTTDYVACCKEKGTCGYGFISALIYGDGEYATAVETSAEGNISIPVAGGAGGFVKAKVLHKRNVHGYVAALVTVTDTQAAKAISVLGDPAAAGIALTEQNLPEQVKSRFELQKIQVVTQGAGPLEFAYVFKDGNGEITENEFVSRYEGVTQSDALAGASKVRSSSTILWSSVGLALSAGAIVVGAIFLQSSCTTTSPLVSANAYGQCSTDIGKPAVLVNGEYVYPGHQGSWGLLPLIFGIAGSIPSGIFLGVGIASTNGSPRDHSITKLDADLYVAKYNRALLRKTIQETETRMRELSERNTPSLSVSPIVSPTFLGLRGTF
jgi:hypothetical protein